MNNYIKADLSRIMRKKSFLSIISGYMFLFLLMIFIVYTPTFNMAEYISKSGDFMGFYSIIIGIPIFLSVYYDDFKSKSMQIAIGYGVPRYKVVLAKIVESFIIAILIGAVFGVITTVIPFLLKIPATNNQIIEIILNVGINTVKVIGYLSISTILVYYSQNAVWGIIVYILLSSSTIYMLFNLALGQDIIVNTFGDLTKNLYLSILISAKEDLLKDAALGLGNSIGIILYIVLPTIISIILFKKKELEF